LLQETQSAVQKWRELLVSNGVGKPLPPAKHWALVSQVANAASWNMGWFSIMEDTPVFGSSSKEYLNWLGQVDAMIESELSALPAQIGALTHEQESLYSEYRTSADESKALSANLNVEILNNEQPQVTELRKTGTMMIIGGLLGVLAWGFGWLVQVTRRTE
jgi:hypothetical protein